ncbi:MAG: SOS response-associated peptidase [Chloroflexi bacterium]|nr:SOS response-associated peptidase [Chloroflexota bacterium]
MFSPEELKSILGLGEIPLDLLPNRNVSPGQRIGVIRDSTTRNVEMYRWGLVPGWAKDLSIGYKMINARAETVATKPSFKNAFARQRCLIPASGFYEWKQDGNQKTPYLFQLRDSRPVTFAGLWECWKDAEEKPLFTCTIITTEPNLVVADYHDRMPVILNEMDRWRWLECNSSADLQNMLKPYPAEKMADPIKIEPL